MGDLVKERRQKGVRIEIIVDGDAMLALATVRRAMIAKLRTPGTHHANVDRSSFDQRVHMLCDAWREPTKHVREPSSQRVFEHY